MSLSALSNIFTRLYTKLSHITFYSYHYIHYCKFNVPRHFDDSTQLRSYNLAKKIYPRYCPLRTTYVRRTLCVVSPAFCDEESSHRQTAGRCAPHCPPGSKDSCPHYATEDSTNESYYSLRTQSLDIGQRLFWRPVPYFALSNLIHSLILTHHHSS